MLSRQRRSSPRTYRVSSSPWRISGLPATTARIVPDLAVSTSAPRGLPAIAILVAHADEVIERRTVCCGTSPQLADSVAEVAEGGQVGLWRRRDRPRNASLQALLRSLGH